MPVHRHPVAAANTPDAFANIPLDQALIDRLKHTYHMIRREDLRLAELFYDRLFAAAPHLRRLFVTDRNVQARKLINTLDSIVQNLSQPRENAAILTALGKRHVDYGAKPEHYDLVIDTLLQAMREVLGPDADENGLNEWRTALRLISNQMIAAAKEHAAGQ